MGSRKVAKVTADTVEVPAPWEIAVVDGRYHVNDTSGEGYFVVDDPADIQTVIDSLAA